MLSILGSLLGFSTSFLPKLMDFFQDKRDKEHELNILLKQSEIQASRERFVAEIEADSKELEILHSSEKTTGTWVDALRGSVRPFITYWWMIIFTLVECSIIYGAFESGQDWHVAIQLAWGEDEKAIFAAIISFWFGHRAFKK